MRVLFGGSAVSRPSCMSDTVLAVERAFGDRLFEVLQLSLGATDCDFSLAVHDCDARRIIAAILELSQSLDYQIDYSLITDVTDNSAHLYFTFFFIVAGTPTASESGGTSFVTTAPAPVTEPLPTRTGATSIVSLPILTSSSIVVSCLRTPS